MKEKIIKKGDCEIRVSAEEVKEGKVKMRIKFKGNCEKIAGNL